jgi:hypothetical protein
MRIVVSAPLAKPIRKPCPNRHAEVQTKIIIFWDATASAYLKSMFLREEAIEKKPLIKNEYRLSH